MTATLDSYGIPETSTPFSPEHQPIGYAYHCPRCGSHRTIYSTLEENWICLDCKLVFQLEEVYDPDYEGLDEEDTNPEIIVSEYKPGGEH